MPYNELREFLRCEVIRWPRFPIGGEFDAFVDTFVNSVNFQNSNEACELIESVKLKYNPAPFQAPSARKKRPQSSATTRFRAFA